MSQPHLRLAARGDLEEMLALYAHLNPDDAPADREAARAAWNLLLDSDLVKVFVAEADGALAASCTLVTIPNVTRGVRPYALIENVVTHAERRRQGLGRLVLDSALAAARDAGCYNVMLATGSKQESTLRFYEKAGFVRGAKTFFQATPQ
jgi:GNAT superfamily N-acetyltransferase